MGEGRLRDLLESMPFGMPRGSLEEMLKEGMLKAELKSAELILAEAEVAGKDGQIRHLGGAIEAFHSKVADLKKKLEESDEKAKALAVQLEDAKKMCIKQVRDIESMQKALNDHERFRQNLEKLLQGRDGKLSVIGELLKSLTSKTTKPNLWKAVKAAQAAL